VEEVGGAWVLQGVLMGLMGRQPLVQIRQEQVEVGEVFLEEVEMP